MPAHIGGRKYMTSAHAHFPKLRKWRIIILCSVVICCLCLKKNVTTDGKNIETKKGKNKAKNSIDRIKINHTML